MSDIYTPTAKQNLTFTRGLDGDPEAAAFTNVWLQALSDHGAYLAAAAQALPALNWGTSVAPPTPASMKRGCYSAATGMWFAVGETGMDYLVASGDSGGTWTAITITGGSGLGTFDVAADATGNIAITNANSKSVYYRTIANVWTNAANQLGATGGAQPYIAFDTTNSQWVACFRDGATGIKVYLSANGTAWAAAAASAPTWAASTDVPKMGTGAGRVLVVHGSGTTYQMAIGGTAGTSWTETAITTTITPTSFTRPIWDATNLVWIVAFSTATAAEVWSSPDGSTWTRKAQWTLNGIQTIAPLAGGSLWLAIDNQSAGASYYSLDAGATWRGCNTQLFPTATPTVLVSGGGMFMAFESTVLCRPSLRMGPGPVLTL